MWSKLAFTASALNGVPSWKVTSSRSWNVYFRPSSEISQDFASHGSKVPSVFWCTSESYTSRRINDDRVETETCRSQLSGSAVVAKVMLPPLFGVPPVSLGEESSAQATRPEPRPNAASEPTERVRKFLRECIRTPFRQLSVDKICGNSSGACFRGERGARKFCVRKCWAWKSRRRSGGFVRTARSVPGGVSTRWAWAAGTGSRGPRQAAGGELYLARAPPVPPAVRSSPGRATTRSMTMLHAALASVQCRQQHPAGRSRPAGCTTSGQLPVREGPEGRDDTVNPCRITGHAPRW